MMRRLDAPSNSDVTTFKTHSSHRRQPARALLQSLEPRIESAYDAYAEDLPSSLPAELSLGPNERRALSENFDATRGKRRLSWLREKLLATARLGRCPYCDTAQVSTLDHYLPRKVYPEYSILSTNLIPACPRCNNARGGALVGQHSCLFWHAYLDTVPEQRILFANLVSSDGALVAAFRVDNANGADPALVAKLAFLFDALKLRDYFAQEAAVMFNDFAPALSRLWSIGGEAAVRDDLRQRAEDYANRRGLNTWMTAICIELAAAGDYSEASFDDLLRSDGL